MVMLRGCVDSVSQDGRTLTGWVQVGDNGDLPVITLKRLGVNEGIAAFGEQRSDVSEKLGVENRSFSLHIESAVDNVHLLAGSHAVVVTVGAQEVPLALSANAYRRALVDFISVVTSKAAETREAVLEALSTGERATSLARYAAESAGAGMAGDLSYVGFPVGLKSGDGAAQLGRDGHLFLIGGTNALHEQYDAPRTAEESRVLEQRAQRWKNAFETSSTELQNLGIPLVKVIIPEKLTALQHLAPLNVPGPTPLFQRLNELLLGDPSYTNMLEMFKTWDKPIDAWQRNDTHCSPTGSLEMARSILNKIPGCSPQVLDGVSLSTVRYRNGDLSAKFFDVPLWDEQHDPDPETLGSSTPTRVFSHSSGNFVGSHTIWENVGAPIDKKVVVFGNSFFGTGDNPARLSWWFSRLFSSYHLKWENKVDLDYVKEVRPDVVIYQTIERFLIRPPA